MEAAKLYKDEEGRLKELESYDIMDSITEKEYEDITLLASSICGMPISLISLLDEDRQWFKSHYGLDVSETPRKYAICGHAIHDREIFIVPDARRDQRFSDNPLVTGDPNVIFYAGVPLLTENGYPLGTLCVIDNKPGSLSETQITALNALSRQVMSLLELRKSKKQLQEVNRKLEYANHELENFAGIAAHDLKSPLNQIKGLTSLLMDAHAEDLSEEGLLMMNAIGKASDRMNEFIVNLLDYAKSSSYQSAQRELLQIEDLITEIKEFSLHDADVDIVLEPSVLEIEVPKMAVQQILLNLFSNAIKYNDKEKVVINLRVERSNDFYTFHVKDNGPGISEENHQKIFELFQTLGVRDRQGKKGYGLGLATIKKIVGSLGGRISIFSEPPLGTTFTFTIKK